MAWITIRAIGSSPSSRRGPGVTPTLYTQMSLLRNSLLNAMREEAPVNKNPTAKNRGALRNSIRASPWMTNGTIWRTEFSALEYVKYVLHGTKAHRIDAKPGGVLAFQWDVRPGFSASASSWLKPISYAGLGGAVGMLGRRGGPSIFAAPNIYAKELGGGTVFVRSVQHPGTAANDFAARAVERTFVAGTPGLTKAVQQAIDDDLLELVMVSAA